MRLGRVATQWASIVVLLLILAVINHYRPDLMGFDVGPSAGQKHYVAVDGDSFKAGDVEVRLHGIDAPEYRQTCKGRDGKDMACGKLARDQLSQLIRGRNITCKTLERDRYGRQVSVCRDGTLDINGEMVRLGWAIAYRKHSLAYVSAEAEARKAKRGIWQGSFEAPETYRDRTRRVEGNVAAD